MYRNQIDLSIYGIEKNKDFTKNIHYAALENKQIVFDLQDFTKTSSSIRAYDRKNDTTMNTEKFLSFLDNGIEMVLLQIGSIYDPTPNEITHTIISEGDISRFAWFSCPYTLENYKIVSKLFEETFGENLESIEIPSVYKPFYKKLERYEQLHRF